MLLYHSPGEWANAKRAALVFLGCSPAYADREADLYRRAVRA